MRSGLVKEATFVGGSLFVIGAALMQFDKKGITDKKYWPYLGVFIVGFSGHLIFEAFGLNKKYCETAFGEESFEASQYPSLKLTENQQSKLRWFMFAYEAHSINDSIYIDEELDDISPKLWTQATTVGLPFTIEKNSRRGDDSAKKMQKRTLSQLVKKGIFEVNESFENKEVPFTINVKLTPKAKKAVMDDIDDLRSLVAESFEADSSTNRRYGGYYSWGDNLIRPTKEAREKMGWSKFDEIKWKSKSQRKKDERRKEKTEEWDMQNRIYRQDRYFCQRYNDIPLEERPTYSTRYRKRGNRCGNCGSRECLSRAIEYQENRKRRAKVYGMRDEIIEGGMIPAWFTAENFEADSKEQARLKKYEKTYGKEGAKVRNRIFKRILANAQDGTKAGQWSARKAQSLTEDYEKAMKGKGKKPYKSSKKTKSQKDLKDWGDQDWTTKSGKKSSKTGERYLPKKAIKALSDKEYKETSDKKRKDTKKGKQFSKQPKKVADKVKKYRADGDIPYGVHVQNHKTTSTVFYKRKPFRKYRGNRHREQARAYAQYMENKLKKNPRHFSYWAEEFEAEGKPTEVEVKRSTNDEKKLMAVFTYPDGKTKTTHFGQRGASDYTKHGEKERMERYLERHGGGTTTSTKEDWQDPTTAGALSRWILWNKPSLSASFNDFKKRFNLKGELKVSKSAETFEAQFTPSQELSDYTPEEIVESSAIEGFQPSKYSVISNSAEGEYSWFDDLRKALEMMQGANNNDLIDYELNVDMIGIDGSGLYEMGYGESIDKVISDLMYYYSQERGQVKPFSQLTRGEVNYYPQGQYDGVGAINFNMKRINEEGAVVEVIFPSWSESSLIGDNALFFRTTPSFDAEGGHDGLNLVMMGVPGSGKGTQSKLITKKYGWPQIGMGDLIRDNMRRKTPLGLKCEPYMAKGSLVPDDIMIEMVSQRLKEDDCKKGFILDGFPRTVPQGKALEKITKIDAVIFLDTEKQIVIDRLGGRRTCSDCGEIFHLVFKPPKSEGKCDVCEGELFIRPDDNRKTILNRLKVFNQKTQPLIDFYEERNLLKVVESNSTPEEVFENIDIVIEELLGKETILASESQDTQYCDYHNQIVSGASLNQIMKAEHYTGDRPMTCPICIRTMSSYQTPSADV